MNSWTFDSRDPDQTLEYGRELGRATGSEGLVVALVGPLGAGKTVFVKGMAEGLGVDPRVVSSPTFVIAQQYVVPEGPDFLHHVDLYRLESEDELESIGFYDMLAPGGVVAIEWADRFPEALGRDHLWIEFDAYVGVRPGRVARVTAIGEEAERVLADWTRRSERADAPRPGVGSFLEMRLLVTLLLGMALWVGAGARSNEEPVRICEQLVHRTLDLLGTDTAECRPALGGGFVAPAEERETGELEGVARILVGDRIDLNRAPASWLETLPGIGPVRAAASVGSGTEQPFVSVHDLERVPGIGPKTRRRLERWVWVSGQPPRSRKSQTIESEVTRDG
jgi:tRNA threonylcarbamoyladenosine biosynthesis protein TsaE